MLDEQETGRTPGVAVLDEDETGRPWCLTRRLATAAFDKEDDGGGGGDEKDDVAEVDDR